MADRSLPAFNVMAKPTGALCNLDCAYCYYLEKEAMYTEPHGCKMNNETLEIFTRKYIHEQPSDEVTFVWHGGEPTLLGMEYFKQAIRYQKKYGAGRKISNSLQTNGVLLTDEWCAFFKEHAFLIGISIDGPENLHDAYRLDKGKHGTFAKVIKGVELLKKHGVEFNTLTVVNNLNCEHGLEVYRFLKEIGSRYMQFIPIVERKPLPNLQTEQMFTLAKPTQTADVTAWSVPPAKFGTFLIAIFNEWVKKDVGRYFVQAFDSALANEVGEPASACIYNGTCGNALAIEFNGDVFSCDHFVYSEYKLGNIHQTSFKKMLLSADQVTFGTDKYNALPRQCKECDVYIYCRGECPKNRFEHTASGEPGLNYLCQAYKLFFGHVKPYIKFMANELAHKRPAANVMPWAAK